MLFVSSTLNPAVILTTLRNIILYAHAFFNERMVSPVSARVVLSPTLLVFPLRRSFSQDQIWRYVSAHTNSNEIKTRLLL